MRLGIAHHLGWAVAVTAVVDHRVVDRRRIELIEPGMPTAPIHHLGGPHVLHRRPSLSMTARSRRWWRRCERRLPGRRRQPWTISRRHCQRGSPQYRSEPGHRTSPKTSRCSVACRMRVGPTRSCTARCWPNSRMPADGASTSTRQRTSRTRRPSSWVSGRTRCSTARAQCWDRHGRRTIGWRSRRRSWSTDLAPRRCSPPVSPVPTGRLAAQWSAPWRPRVSTGFAPCGSRAADRERLRTTVADRR